MNHVIAWLSSNTAGLGVFGAAVAFMISTWQQVSQRRAEANERQFQAFHDVLEKVVAPQPKDGQYYYDRQAAVIFELRHFPRYFDFTHRLLTRLRTKWANDPTPGTPLLVEEIDLTLEHIRAHRS